MAAWGKKLVGVGGRGGRSLGGGVLPVAGGTTPLGDLLTFLMRRLLGR